MSLVVPLMMVITMLLCVKFTSNVYDNVTLCQPCWVPGANDLSILWKKKIKMTVTFKMSNIVHEQCVTCCCC